MTQTDHPCLSRREARRRDRRDAILDVARRSFMDRGYAATTMSSIAASLGGSKGTLWNYFPNKDELFAAVLHQATDDYHAGLMQILDSHGPLEPTLHRFSSALLSKVTSPQSIALLRLVVTEARRFPKVGAIFFEIAPRHTRALLAQFVRGEMDAGRLRSADPELAARTLITLILGGCHQQIVWGQMEQPAPDQIAADVAHAVSSFLRIYAPEEGTPTSSTAG